MAENSFAQGIIEGIRDRVTKHRDSENKLRDIKAEAALQSILGRDTNGNFLLTDDEAEQQMAEVEKLYGYNKDAKGLMGGVREMIGKIRLAVMGGNKAMAGRATQQAKDVLTGGQGGSIVKPPQTTGPMSEQTPIGGSSTQIPPYTPPPPVRSQPVQKVASALPGPPQRSSTALMRAGAPNPQAELLAKETRAREAAKEMENLKATHAQELAKVKMKPQKADTYTGEDGKKHVIYVDWSKLTEDGSPYSFEIDSDGEVQPARSWLTGAAIAASDAKRRASNGEQFKLPGGAVIDVSQLAPQEELRAWAGGNAGTYGVFNQETKQMTANNLVRTYPALDPTAQTVQGAARVGTASTSETPMQNVKTGKTELVTTQQTSQPMTGAGPTPPAAPVPPPARTPPALPVRPATETTVAPSPITGGPVRTRELNNVMPGTELQRQRTFATPLRDISVELIGNPEIPDFKGLLEYGYLMDDPMARQRIGTAVRLIVQDMVKSGLSDESIGAAAAGFGASLNSGGLWSYLRNKLGITQAIAGQEASSTERAVSDLKDDENQFVTRALALYSNIIGLRSLSKAGAYKFSADAIARDAPIPGLNNVINSKSFYDKGASLFSTLARGANDNAISDDILPEKQEWTRQANELARKGRGMPATGGATPPPKRSTAATRVVGGTTYYETAPGSGKWSTTAPK